MSFVQLFGRAGGDDEDGEQEQYRRPAWYGPPDGELGAVVPLGLVVGRSEQAVVAVSHATVYSGGVSFDFVAEVRGLPDARTSRLFHDQHLFDDQEEPPDGFLRLGLELPGGVRVSNLGDRRALHRAAFANPDAEPDEPVFMQHGGGGGSSGGGRMSMRPGFWLWPLPQPDTIRVVCEWPAPGIPLSAVELDGAALRDATTRVVPLWPAA